MDDLKKLSVERLRDLARRHLGKGHSRLRTKAQLLEALKEVLKGTIHRLEEAVESVIKSHGGVKVVDFPRGRRGRVRGPSDAEHAHAARPPDEAPSSGTTRRTSTPPEARDATAGKRSADARKSPAPASRSTRGRNGARARNGGGRPATATEEIRPTAQPDMPHAATLPGASEAPVEEGFFQEPAVPRRPRRAPAPAEPLDPTPFISPREVGTDAPVLLVRDPTTLFVFWDFRRELERGAALGLREPRLLLRLYRGDDLDRSLALPLGARSTYVTGLGPGEAYTAEVLLLGRDGWTRPVGGRSAVRRLPPG